MKQSRAMSFLETALSTFIGLAVALATQLVVFPLFGWHPDLSTNLVITAIFTLVSIIRQFLVRRLFEALHIRRPLSPFMLAVIAERARQIEQEGWSAEHDDKHVDGELARAGGCYLFSATGVRLNAHGIEWLWPWERQWWKPKIDDRRRDLVRGCALGIAEGEKFDRNRRRHRTKKKPESTAAMSLVTDDNQNNRSRHLDLNGGQL